ncbi:MAG: PEP-CTERM sorting domain-containing protein [Syntrophobacteraceae bacterium]
MKIGRMFAIGCAALLVVGVAATLAGADQITTTQENIVFSAENNSNTITYATYATGTLTVNVDATNPGDSTAVFTITPTTAAGSNNGMQDFWFNFSGGTLIGTSAVTTGSGGFSVSFSGVTQSHSANESSWEIIQANAGGGENSQFGTYDYKVYTSGGADLLSSLTFTVTSSLITGLGQFNTDQGHLNPGSTSQYYFAGELNPDPYYAGSLGGGSDPIPEPCTMLLLGSGLVGLGVFRKRFKKA